MKSPRDSFRYCRICKSLLRLIKQSFKLSKYRKRKLRHLLTILYIDYKNSSYRSKTNTFKSISKITKSISKNLPIVVFQIDRLNPIDWLFTSYRLENNTYSIDKKKYESIRINLSIVRFRIDRLILIDWKFTTYRFESHISQSIDQNIQSIC